ncbi:heparinase II/III family protein [Psychrobacter sp. ASPA161_6]|uniref:heparinase II/III family protein n=1 Tax=Psychrobacter sp. ASPA161_6 TaxID=3160962 RepID=UPI003F823727
MIKIFLSEKLSVYIDDSEAKIQVSLNKKIKDCVYACYFYFKNGEVVKYHYQHALDFFHSVNLEELSKLNIRFFIWDKKKNVRSSEFFYISKSLDIFYKYKYFLNNESNGSLLGKDIERYITNTGNIEKGRMLFEDNKLKLTTFPAVKWDNWEADPFNNRSWQWALHWFDFSKHLLAFYHKTNNEEVLCKLKELISSWIKNYLYDEKTDFEFIWHDHATALRAKQILLLLSYLKKYNNSWMNSHLEFILLLFEALDVLGAKLEQENFYSKHTNHGLEQVRVLMLLGVTLDNKKWVDLSILRLNDELNFSFTSEGVHKENSPGYHQFVFKIFLSIIESFSSTKLLELNSNFKEIAPKALKYITYILRPDNKLPIIGDTELKPTSDAYKNFFSGTAEYECFLYSLTQGRKGKIPDKNNIVYPESGYAIFRNTWGNEEDFEDSMQLIFKAGCLSRYHHQQDENNFVLFAFGEDWIIDSGLYNYVNKDPIRYYVRRRQAHNIPLVSNTSYSHEDFSHRIKSWSIIDYSENDSNPYVLAENTVLQNVKHSRKIEYNNLNIKVEDSINCLDNVERNVTFLLHVPMDKEIRIIDEQILISSKNQNKILSLSLNAKPDKIEVRKGVNKKQINSIISLTANNYTDSQVIRFIFKEITNIDVRMLMVFS